VITMVKVLAARYYEPRKPLKLEQVELPKVQDDDVLVRIKAAGVCHSDLHTINGLFPPAKPPPITLGHEMSGIVEEKGKNVKKVEIGDRVGADYVLSCGTCSYCVAGKDNLCDNFKVMAVNTDGAWTEKIVVPQRHIHRLPHNVGFPEGAIMNCAVMTSYHAMKLAQVSAGDTVLVYGLGGVGINAIQWAKVFGATEIIGVDLEEGKLDLAKRTGATITVNPKDGDPVQRVRELTGGGVDVGFEVIGLVDTVRKMIGCVKKGGKAVMVGMCFDNVPISPVNDVMTPEIKLMSPQDHLKAEIPQVLKLIENGRFDLSHSVSHRLPLKEVNEGVRILNERIGNPVRVVLEP
jgi:2-desacetyl-2-hydroxyethyl bacteriochlorophyllide A dehydrogenase